MRNKKILIYIIVASVAISSFTVVFYEECTVIYPKSQNVSPTNPLDDVLVYKVPPEYKQCTSILKNIIMQQTNVTIEECTDDFNKYYIDEYWKKIHERNARVVAGSNDIVADVAEILRYMDYLEQNCPLYKD